MAKSPIIALFALALAWSAPAEPASTRKPVVQLTPAELASLRRGVAQMKAWNSAPHGSLEYRRSWIYWANMHRFFGPGCTDPARLNNPGMSGLSAHSANSADQQLTWCKCEHGTFSFLTWHRMYLYYFEKVLQAAAGDPGLRIPYWDPVANPKIPLAYRVRRLGSGIAGRINPLYTENRQSQLNAGLAALDSAVTSPSQAMSKTFYGAFSEELEGQPHGGIHCALGWSGCGTGYMGAAASAANDPIFWSHHSNIDRLYECWLSVNPSARLPGGELLNQTFSFPDATGAIVTRRVGDMLTTGQLGYDYGPGNCAGLRIRQISVLPNEPAPFPISGPLALDPRSTVVPIRLSSEQIQIARSRRQATIVVAGITTDGIPRLMYRVVARGRSGHRQTLGVISFFTETAHERHHHARRERVRRFDIPASSISLLSGGSITFEPITGLRGVPVDARELRAEAQRAIVRIRSITLELY